MQNGAAWGLACTISQQKQHLRHFVHPASTENSWLRHQEITSEPDRNVHRISHREPLDMAHHRLYRCILKKYHSRCKSPTDPEQHDDKRGKNALASVQDAFLSALQRE